MDKVPTLEEIQALPEKERLEIEAKLVEQTDNGPRPEDGPQPTKSEVPEVIDNA